MKIRFKILITTIISIVVMSSYYYLKYHYIPSNIISNKVVNKTLNDSILGVGYVTSEIISDVSGQISGRIEKINFIEGQKVKYGDILAKIDDKELKYNLESSTINHKKNYVNIDLIKSNLIKLENDINLAIINSEKAKLNYEYNKSELERSKNLLTQNNITQQIYDSKKIQLDVSEKEYKASKLNIESIKTEKNKQLISQKIALLDIEYAKSLNNIARVKENYSEIKAPFDGVVVKKLSEEGMVLNAGSPVIRLVKKDAYLVSAYIDITKMQNITIGQSAEVTLNRNPNKKYQGVVYRISQEGDRTTDELKVDIKLKTPPINLYLDEKAIIEILLPKQKKVKLIPSKSILKKKEDNFVYVLDKNIARLKKITIGNEENGFTEVINGLNDSDIILFSNSIINISENQSINIKNK